MAAGLVRTVLGDVEPTTLGRVMTHEHLLIEFGRWRREAGFVAPAPHPMAAAPFVLENLGWIRRHWSSHPVNMRLDEEDVAVREVRLFKEAGGGALVDATNPDLGRDAAALARISRETGVAIVMGCGNYVADYQPLDMDGRSEDAVLARIVADVTEGADGTAVRAGIIGEIGSSWPITSNEAKALRAAARAMQVTGAPLLIHPGRDGAAPLATMAIVADAGGEPGRTIMSHLDRTLFSVADMLELARTGCYLEFDLFGQESSFYPLAPIDMPNDATRVDYLLRLAEAGYGDRLLVSHDICYKTHLVKYGGDGYAHILRNVVPLMARKGMPPDLIDAILVANPARALAMV